MDPKIKNYNQVFHTCSAANEFTFKLLKKFTKLYFFAENKKLFHKNKNIFRKNKNTFHKNKLIHKFFFFTKL